MPRVSLLKIHNIRDDDVRVLGICRDLNARIYRKDIEPYQDLFETRDFFWTGRTSTIASDLSLTPPYRGVLRRIPMGFFHVFFFPYLKHDDVTLNAPRRAHILYTPKRPFTRPKTSGRPRSHANRLNLCSPADMYTRCIVYYI